jgi:putative ABC transport system substrate-binding protein
MMNMKIVGSLIFSAVLAFAQIAEPQQAKQIPLIGYLALGNSPGEPEAQFKDRLRALGWLERQNIAIEYRWAGNDMERLRLLAEELGRMKVDLIVASATPVIEAARKATTTIPIVMLGAADPVASGFVASLAHPGGNITGLSLQSAELSGKRLELLKEVVPTLGLSQR